MVVLDERGDTLKDEGALELPAQCSEDAVQTAHRGARNYSASTGSAAPIPEPQIDDLTGIGLGLSGRVARLGI